MLALIFFVSLNFVGKNKCLLILIILPLFKRLIVMKKKCHLQMQITLSVFSVPLYIFKFKVFLFLIKSVSFQALSVLFVLSALSIILLR